MDSKQILIIALGSALLLAPEALRAGAAQDNQESVADAARKAQAAKKKEPKAKLNIDNDNLDTITGTVSVVGQQPAPAANQSATAKPAAAAGDKNGSVKDEAYWRKAFADANNKLTADAHELDVDQRDFNLKQQQYYSDPNQAMKEQNSREDLNNMKTKIDALTAAVAQDKQAISDLEDALRQAGGDPGWATLPSSMDSTTPSSATTPATMPASTPASNSTQGPPLL